jgi:hypothetical protein
MGPTITIASTARIGILQMTENVIMTSWSFAALAMVMVEAKKCEQPRSFRKCNGNSKKMRARKASPVATLSSIILKGKGSPSAPFPDMDKRSAYDSACPASDTVSGIQHGVQRG